MDDGGGPMRTYGDLATLGFSKHLSLVKGCLGRLSDYMRLSSFTMFHDVSRFVRDSGQVGGIF